MLVNGDCLEEVQKLVDKGVQVDSIVTDPPYHLTSIVERFGKEGSANANDCGSCETSGFTAFHGVG